jgi:hypothetical protein
MLKPTEFDQLVGSPSLQMLKAMLPFLDSDTQQWVAIYIQTQVLQNTMALFQTSHEPPHWSPHQALSPAQLISYLRPYGGPTEQGILDDIQHAIDAMKLYQRYSDLQKRAKGPVDPMDLVKELLPPDQASMFQTYSTLFQKL